MSATTRAKLVVAGHTVLIWAGVAWLIAICLLGMCAALIRWHRLDNWCAKQIEK